MMDDLELVPASNLSSQQLAHLLNQAYADYPIPIWLTPRQFEQMCGDVDVDLTRSVVALKRGAPVGLALCSIRGCEGWVSGVGVRAQWRRHGIARRMMVHIQRSARDEHLRRLRLEVLERNEAGVRLYTGLGFVRERDLLVLRLVSGEAEPKPKGGLLDLSSVPPEQLLNVYAPFHNTDPSWQRELPTLKKRVSRLSGLALKDGPRILGYVLYQAQLHSYAVLDLAVALGIPQRLGLARDILATLRAMNPDRDGYVINLPAQDPLFPAFSDAGYRIWYRQYEMAWEARAGG